MEFDKLATTASHEAGAEVNILSPVDGSPTDVFIKIKGADSKAWRIQRKRQTSAIVQAKAEDRLDDLDYEALDIEALVAITIDWRNLTKGGKPYKCTKANAKALYEQSPSIVQQLLTFLGDSANFTKG
jgi:hypothetical protein